MQGRRGMLARAVRAGQALHLTTTLPSEDDDARYSAESSKHRSVTSPECSW